MKIKCRLGLNESVNEGMWKSATSLMPTNTGFSDAQFSTLKSAGSLSWQSLVPTLPCFIFNSVSKHVFFLFICKTIIRVLCPLSCTYYRKRTGILANCVGKSSQLLKGLQSVKIACIIAEIPSNPQPLSN
jgi:hypothetical protein